MKPKYILILLFFLILACSSTTQVNTIATSVASTVSAIPSQQKQPTIPMTVQQTGTLPTMETPKLIATDVPPTLVPTHSEIPIDEQYLGDTNQQYGYTLTGLAIDENPTPWFMYEAESGKKLIAILIDIGNISGNIFTDFDDVVILDTEGYKYSMGIGIINYQLDFFTLLRGEHIRGWVGFVIPDNSTPKIIKVPIEFLSDNFIQASLLQPPTDHSPINVAITPTQPSSKLGDIVTQFGYSITALKIDNPAIEGVKITPTEGYKIVAVEVIISNDSSSEKLDVFTDVYSLVDTNGFVYKNQQYLREGEPDYGELSIGEKVRGWITFYVPEDSIPLYFKFQINISDRHLIVGL